MKKLTILCSPVNAVGHVNACTGALKAALARGHRVIFVLEEASKGKLAAHGFEEYVYSVEKSRDKQNAGEFVLSKALLETKVLGDYNVWEKLENLIQMFHSDRNHQEAAIFDGAIKKAIEKFNPDLIYYDGACLYPAIHYSDIPWVKNNSAAPNGYLLAEDGVVVPPGFSGFPSDGSLEEFQKFNKIRQAFFFSKKYNNLVQSLGYEPFPNDSISPESQHLTVYSYPEEIDYSHVKSLGWFNLEVFNKAPVERVDFETLVPSEFLSNTLDGKFSGKFIYVSMGSIGSVDLDLMNRLVATLTKTNHKYIVSKGPRHAEYSLPPNMYGDRYLPQTAIIPHVDVVIIHGGNNTVTETFAQGKPMIVLPLFGDQFDNAQRLHETDYGIRLEPYKFTESELINSIEKLANDQKLKEKLDNASKRIQSLNRHEELVDRLEQLVANADSVQKFI